MSTYQTDAECLAWEISGILRSLDELSVTAERTNAKIIKDAGISESTIKRLRAQMKSMLAGMGELPYKPVLIATALACLHRLPHMDPGLFWQWYELLNDLYDQAYQERSTAKFAAIRPIGVTQGNEVDSPHEPQREGIAV